MKNESYEYIGFKNNSFCWKKLKKDDITKF